MNNYKYIQYSRKSSEAKEKQALSIDDQKAESKEYAIREHLNVIKYLEESKSAFKPHNRTEFDKMIAMIKNSEVDAILTWKPDRLCRNPEEGGMILQMLQDGLIKEIRTPLGDYYDSNSDHLVLQIHFGMANQYSRNLSQNVKRGYYRKIHDRKQYPMPAPLGYENFGEIGQRNIRPHVIEAPLIKEAFTYASTGTNSLGIIADTLKQRGLLTKAGKRVSKSHLHRILSNPVYYGFFNYSGELCEGNYTPLISKSLFDLVQEKLKDRSKAKNVSWRKDYNGLIKCGLCGCAITTTKKVKLVKKLGGEVVYTYHHCTKRKGPCKQQPVKEQQLVSELLKICESIAIDEEVWKLGMDLLKERYADELKKTNTQYQYIQQQQGSVRDQISRLVKMRADNELTKEEFLDEKNRLLNKLASLNEHSGDNEQTLKEWLEQTQDFFDTSFYAMQILSEGTPDEKLKMLSKIGKNFLLNNGKVEMTYKKPFDVLLKPAMRTSWRTFKIWRFFSRIELLVWDKVLFSLSN